MTEFLLENGAEILNDKILYYPVSNGNVNLIKLLVEYGANINFINSMIGSYHKKEEIKNYYDEWENLSEEKKTLIYLNNILNQKKQK